MISSSPGIRLGVLRCEGCEEVGLAFRVSQKGAIKATNEFWRSPF